MPKMIKTNFLVEKGVVWWKRSSCASSVFPFYSFLSRAESVLVCFPARGEEFASAANYLPLLADVFPSSKIYLFLPFVEAESFSAGLRPFEIISPRSSDIRLFSLPNRNFVERIKRYSFGITLDLDLKGCLFNALTCLMSGSPLRIGVRGKWGKPFYNVELATQKGLVYLDQKYDAMVETLRNLTNGATK